MGLEVAKSLLEDREIDSEAAKLSYLNLVTENLRSNNKKITRNSFWMVLSTLLYLMILVEEPSLKKISILFVTIDNSVLLLNLIPIFFAFVFFQNVTLWNNNINLYGLFEKLSKQLFNLGLTSDTHNILKPFSLTHHVLNYQYENKRIKGIFKLPLTIILLVITFFPILFVVFGIYQIAIMNPPTFIPITCGILSGFIGFSAILQAKSVYKN